MLAIASRLAGPALLLLASGCSRSQAPLFPYLRANVPPAAVEIPVAKIATPSTTEPTLDPDGLLTVWLACLSPSWPSIEEREAPCDIVARRVGIGAEQLRADAAGSAETVEAAYRAELFRQHLSPHARAPKLALFRKATNAVAELGRATESLARLRKVSSPATLSRGSFLGLMEEEPMSFEAVGEARFLEELWAFAGEPSQETGAERDTAAAVAWMIGAARLRAAKDAPPALRLRLVEPTLAILLGYRTGPPAVMEPSARWFEYIGSAADALLPSGWLAVPRYVAGQGHAQGLAEVQAEEAILQLFATRMQEAAKKTENAEIRRAVLVYADELRGAR